MEKSEKPKPDKISDWEFLEELTRKLIAAIRKKKFDPKLSDVLKLIELKQKIKDPVRKEKLFWELIDQIRKEELSKLEDNKKLKKIENT